MPHSAPRPCTEPGCNALVSSGSRCPKHPYKRARSKQGKENKRLYNTQRWRRGRDAYLLAHPLCVYCAQKDKVNPASVVDHKRPHNNDPVLFFDQSNWQGLCYTCHNRKTALYDGGFGRKPRHKT